MLGSEPSIVEMTQERLCRHVLGEDVRGVVGRVDLDDSHQIMLHQLLDEKMFDSMCLAFFDEPILVAMLLPLDKSVWIRVFIFLMLLVIGCGYVVLLSRRC